MDLESVLTDCFWCGTLWESGAYERCPRCAATVELGIITPDATGVAAAAEVTDQ